MCIRDRTYTKEEFCEHWVSTKTNGEEKGIVLLLEPTDEFYSQELTEGGNCLLYTSRCV